MNINLNKKKKELFKSSFFFCALLIVGCHTLFISCEEKNPYNQGKIMYENFCENCHMEDGSGLAQVIPPLAGSDYLLKYPEKLPCLIRAGIKGEMVVNGITYDTEMPGVPRLSEFEITNIINYINTAWGNTVPIEKHTNVRNALKECSPESKKEF